MKPLFGNSFAWEAWIACAAQGYVWSAVMPNDIGLWASLVIAIRFGIMASKADRLTGRSLF
jgi:hypothetical protein